MSSAVTSKPIPRQRPARAASSTFWLEDADDTQGVITQNREESSYSLTIGAVEFKRSGAVKPVDADTAPAVLVLKVRHGVITAGAARGFGIRVVYRYGHCRPHTPAPHPQRGGTRSSLPLEKLCDLSAAGDREAAIDLVLDYFDGLLARGRVAECDAALASLNEDAVRSIIPSALVSILGITLRAKTSLPARAPFFARVFAEIQRRKGRRYAKELLEKYR